MRPTLQDLALRAATSSEREARRIRLAADLRAEGASDASVARLTDDKTVDAMLAHERRVVDAIRSLFGAP